MPQLSIEERSSLGQEEFSHSFVRQHRPVILRGGIAHWPAVKKWSPEYLRTVVAGAKITIKSKSDYGSGGSKRQFEDKKEVDFAEVVDMMTRDDAPDLSYARQIRVWKDIAELAADVEAPGYGPALIAKSDGNLWIGPAGTVAQMHWDPAHNLFAQVRGEKKWILVPPSESHMTYGNKFPLQEIVNDSRVRAYYPAVVEKIEKALLATGDVEELVNSHLTDAERRLIYSWLAQMNNCDVNAEDPDPRKTPLFLAAHRYEGTLRAGDLMFIPYGWRHYVRSLTPSVSLNWFFVPQESLPPDLSIIRTLLEHLVCSA